MAKVTNPLMSFDAEGQLGQKGNGVVYKTYRGEKIAFHLHRRLLFKSQ